MSETGQDSKDSISELTARAGQEPVASFLGLKLLELSQGYARVGIKLLPEHLNFNGLVFGGILMALADQAFAYTVNSVRQPSIATQFNIHFISAARAGDKLVAEARVIKNGRRVSIAEMSVTNQDGKLIARATGTTVPIS